MPYFHGEQAFEEGKTYKSKYGGVRVVLLSKGPNFWTLEFHPTKQVQVLKTHFLRDYTTLDTH